MSIAGGRAREQNFEDEMEEVEKEGQTPPSPPPDIGEDEMVEHEGRKRKGPEEGWEDRIFDFQDEEEERKKRLGINTFKIRKPLGEKDENIDENLRLSMDNEMEFTKFKIDTIEVSLVEPDRESMLDSALSSSNEYEFPCMKVPPPSGFYKAINWRGKGFTEVPFKSNHPNPLSVMGGFMGAGKDAKLSQP